MANIPTLQASTGGVNFDSESKLVFVNETKAMLLRWSQRVSTDNFSESKLTLLTYRREKVSNGLDDLKAAIYACPSLADDGIHSDHGYLYTCDNPLGPP